MNSPSSPDAADLAGRLRDAEQRLAGMDDLQARESLLRLATDVAQLGIFDFDHLTGRLYWSPRLCEIYGVDVTTPLSMV